MYVTGGEVDRMVLAVNSSLPSYFKRLKKPVKSQICLLIRIVISPYWIARIANHLLSPIGTGLCYLVVFVLFCCLLI